MNDRVLGGGILLGSLVGLALYFYLIFVSPWSFLVIQISAFAAVAAVLVIVAWIGYTLATTPPPKPIEDLDLEESEKDAEEKGEESSKEEK